MIDLKSKRPLIIAGPCSAESEEQLLLTARALADSGKVDILRAGIWKPRTNPGSFEGVGEQGLAWMARAGRETGLPVAVEVANAKHLYTALSYGVDMVWLGARTTVSPFSVQEIADALRGTQIPVLLKNPMNPDIDLWGGAVERMARSVGYENVGLIHRGFSFCGKSRYRNSPMWHLAIEMRRRYPEMMMVCDPSHIGGKREYLYEIGQKAADLSFDGLIIESHNCPAKALSDAAQQVTPEDLITLLDKIRWRKGTTDSPEFAMALDRFRGEIDQIDAELFDLLARRMRVAEQIGMVKKENDVAILQSGRWNSITERVIAQAKELQLSEEFLTTVLEAIHIESINRQNIIMNSGE